MLKVPKQNESISEVTHFQGAFWLQHATPWAETPGENTALSLSIELFFLPTRSDNLADVFCALQESKTCHGTSQLRETIRGFLLKYKCHLLY